MEARGLRQLGECVYSSQGHKLDARPLDYFEARRRKRNVIDYNHAAVATHTEAEIVAEANDFFALVDCWIAANHPKLNA